MAPARQVTAAALLEECVTFADVLETFHAVAHTGPLIVHFAQGKAVTVELPCEPQRKRLDTGKKKAHA